MSPSLSRTGSFTVEPVTLSNPKKTWSSWALQAKHQPLHRWTGSGRGYRAVYPLASWNKTHGKWGWFWIQDLQSKTMWSVSCFSKIEFVRHSKWDPTRCAFAQRMSRKAWHSGFCHTRSIQLCKQGQPPVSCFKTWGGKYCQSCLRVSCITESLEERTSMNLEQTGMLE